MSATPEQRLYQLWGEIRDLSSAEDLLGWDQETGMPPRAHQARGDVMATLAGLKHQRLTSPELSDVLGECAAVAEPDSVLEAQVREARRKVDRAVRVPLSLARELAHCQSVAINAWRAARERDDFAYFQPHLERMLELCRQEAQAISPDRPAYDVMLDEWEPGATEAQLAPLFEHLHRELVPLVQAVRDSGVTVDESPVQGDFPAAAQQVFVRRLSAALGFDFEAGRLDPSTHPFCTGIQPPYDVRMTWRWYGDDLRPGLFGVLHESGHGLYDQGLPTAWQRTPIGEPSSTALHESQSRLWENLVGRSRSFWRWALPLLHQDLPATAGLTLDQLWPALHTVVPSLIRVEADEGTYNLHILVRFELERALFTGNLPVADLPAAWDEAYQRLLGIRPPRNAEGVLQDIHWSQGSFGYFPTYSLGTLASCQLFAAARRDLGDLDAAFAAGEFRPLLAWLREHIHQHGSRYPAAELIRRATGQPLAPDAFLAYIRDMVEQVYGVTTAAA